MHVDVMAHHVTDIDCVMKPLIDATLTVYLYIQIHTSDVQQ